jgi:hypothetical protein
MGIFWDLLQQSQIDKQKQYSKNLESRIMFLESELQQTQIILNSLIKILEERFGEDIDGDGKVG